MTASVAIAEYPYPARLHCPTPPCFTPSAHFWQQQAIAGLQSPLHWTPVCRSRAHVGLQTAAMQNHEEGSRQNGKEPLSGKELGQDVVADRDMKAARSPSPRIDRKREAPNGDYQSDSKIPMSCVLQPLLLPKDPEDWAKEHVQQWLKWTQDEFNLPEPVNPSVFDYDGKQLVALTKDDFVKLTSEATGDVIHGHLTVLRKAAVASQGRLEGQRSSKEGTPEKQVIVTPSRHRNSPRASPKPRSSPRVQSSQQENGIRSPQIGLALNPTLAMSNAQIQNTVVTSAMTHPIQLTAAPGIPVQTGMTGLFPRPIMAHAYPVEGSMPYLQPATVAGVTYGPTHGAVYHPTQRLPFQTVVGQPLTYDPTMAWMVPPRLTAPYPSPEHMVAMRTQSMMKAEPGQVGQLHTDMIGHQEEKGLGNEAVTQGQVQLTQANQPGVNAVLKDGPNSPRHLPASQLGQESNTPESPGVGGNLGGQIQLWQFLLELLSDKRNANCIAWAGHNGEFKLLNPDEVSRLWGMRKKKPNMNYDKLSRAIRYYYDKKIMHKVPGKRYVYRFDFETLAMIGNPSELPTAMATAPTTIGTVQVTPGLSAHSSNPNLVRLVQADVSPMSMRMPTLAVQQQYQSGSMPSLPAISSQHPVMTASHHHHFGHTTGTYLEIPNTQTQRPNSAPPAASMGVLQMPTFTQTVQRE